ncbi:MAG: hypothetical protein DRQ55_01885 [Planctomycetota bacterium]|nr:MAG: hypothetical protein DRQ55_01885 [Planctomycetota bacterium]
MGAVRVALVSLGLALSASPAWAQSPTLLVSTSSNELHPSGSVGDEEIVWHTPGVPLRTALPTETLSLLLGPASGGELHILPGDVDALHDPGEAALGGGLMFSLVSNQGGWEDGDVLRISAAGLELVWSEDALVTALGVTDGNLDLDALLVEDGMLLFSLAEDEDSTLLSGDMPGVIEDGDVVGWDPVTGAVWHVLTESAVDTLVSNVVASGSLAGDLKGLARNHEDGGLLFCVQSPSSHDGAVFSTSMGGSLLDGHDEQDFGFQGAGELDALGLARSHWSSLGVSDAQPAAGTTLVITLEGAKPSEPCLLLLSMASEPSWFDMGGWGGLVLAQDTLFNLSLQALPSLSVMADGMGSANWSFDVPLALQPVDVVAQVFSFANPHMATNPVLIEAGQ